MVVISPFFIQETSIYEIKQHMVLIILGTRPALSVAHQSTTTDHEVNSTTYPMRQGNLSYTRAIAGDLITCEP